MAGRPRKPIDWDTVEKLCHMQATHEEICDWFCVDEATLWRACKRDQKTDFATYFAQKRAGGKASLRRYVDVTIQRWEKLTGQTAELIAGIAHGGQVHSTTGS